MDEKTVFLTLFIVNLYLGTIMYVFRRKKPGLEDIKYWILGSLLMAFGYGFASLRKFIPENFSIVTSDSLFMLAMVSRLFGLKKVYRLPLTKKFKLIFLLVVLSLISYFIYFTYVDFQMKYRIFVLYSFFAIIAVWAIYVSYRQKSDGDVLISVFAIFSFLIAFVFCAFHLYKFSTLNKLDNFFHGSLYVTFLFVSLFLFDVTWAIIIMLLSSQRINSKLDESEKQYKLLAENITDVIWVLNITRGKFSYVSPSVIHLTGFTDKEAMEQGIDESLEPKSAALVKNRVAITLAEFIKNPEKRSFNYNELQQFCKDGSLVWIETVTQYRYAPNGDIEVLGVSRNIENRKKAAQELLIQQERFEQIVKNSFDMFVLLDKDGKQKNIWGSVEKITGYTTEEILARENMMGLVHPEDYGKTKSEFEKILNKNAGTIEFRFLHKNGNWIDIEAHTSNQKDNPILESVVVNLRDITERKRIERDLRESEIKLKEIFDNSIDNIFVAEVCPQNRFKILTINNQLEKVMNITKIQVEGRYLEEIVDEKASHEIATKYSECVKQRKSIFYEEVANFPDGAKHYLTNLTPVINPLGEVIRLVGISRDITERKNAEEALRESEEMIRSVANNIENGIIYKVLTKADGTRKFLYISENVYKYYGIKAEDILQDASLIYNLVHPDDKERLRQEEENAMKNFSVFKSEVRFVNYEGKIRWSYLVSKPYRLNDSIYWNGIEIDITDRKEKEQEIKRLSSALVQSPVSIIMTDKKGVVEYLNPQFTIDTGYEPSDFIGSSWRLMRAEEEDDRLINEISSTLKSGKPWNGQLKGRKKNGTEFWNEASISSVLDEKGRVLNYIAVFQDISEHKDFEQKLEHIAENLKKAQEIGNVGHWEYKIGQEEMYWSEQIYIIHEINFGDFKPNVKNGFDFVHPEDVAFVKESILNSAHNENNELIFRIITGKGNLKYLSQRIYIRYNKSGEPIELLGTIHDITDLKLSQINLIKQKAQLEDLNAAKDKIFSVIAHDLRSPFNSIQGLSEILINNFDKYDREKIQTIIETINSSSRNTINLLENLLNWAKNQTGNLQFNPEKIQLKNLVAEMVNSTKALAGMKHIDIRFQIAEDLTVYADRNMVNIILRNLLSNAVKFTGRNGEVSVVAVLKNNEIEISVKDTGIGIEASILKRLFKIDNGVISTGTNNEKGSGLGLVLCHEFVGKQGGKIRVKSERGKGSTFSFTLPDRNQNSDDAE
ncbi:MAG: PAS domain S-box protein [Bacteroidales bacterium]